MKYFKAFLILLVLAVMAFSLWFLLNKAGEHESVKSGKPLVANKAKASEDKLDDLAQLNKDSQQTSKSNLESSSGQSSEQNSENQAEADEYLQKRFALTEQIICIGYLESQQNKQLEDSFTLLGNTLTEIQKDYFAGFYQHCENLNIDKSQVSVKQLEKLEKIESVHPWASLLKGEIRQSDLTFEEIEGLLSTNSLYILAEAPDRLNTYYEEVVHWGIEAVLQNHHYAYVNTTIRTAHQQYLCSLGARCDAHSSYMMYLCYSFEESCGLSFEQYVETLLTESQKADLALAFSYLSNKYKPLK